VSRRRTGRARRNKDESCWRVRADRFLAPSFSLSATTARRQTSASNSCQPHSSAAVALRALLPPRKLIQNLQSLLGTCCQMWYLPFQAGFPTLARLSHCLLNPQSPTEAKCDVRDVRANFDSSPADRDVSPSQKQGSCVHFNCFTALGYTTD